jgi:hypothetical protein
MSVRVKAPKAYSQEIKTQRKKADATASIELDPNFAAQTCPFPSGKKLEYSDRPVDESVKLVVFDSGAENFSGIKL